MRWTELMGEEVEVEEGKRVEKRVGDETTQSPVNIVGASPSSSVTGMPSGLVSAEEDEVESAALAEEAEGLAGGGGGFSWTMKGGCDGGTGMPAGGERSRAPRGRPRI
jgi:hypothetical protein